MTTQIDDQQSPIAPPGGSKALEDPIKFAKDTANGFKVKADHNKREALQCFVGVVACSLVSPLFVTLGEGLFWGKILPSLLSLSAAGSTAWLQLRKPQNLWSLYRDCQRRLEDHIYRFNFFLLEYDADEPTRTRLLADAARTTALEAHTRWLPLVPTPESIVLSTKQNNLKSNSNELERKPKGGLNETKNKSRRV